MQVDDIKLILADDRDLVRNTLRASFEARPGFHIVAEARNGREAVDQTAKLQPDVLVLDMVMPELNGLEVIRELKQRHVSSKVVVLSMHSNVAYAYEALREGALSYMLKTAPFDEVARAVREVALGNRFLTAPLSERVLEAYSQSRLQSAEGSEE